jgi:hypothetical protein
MDNNVSDKGTIRTKDNNETCIDSYEFNLKSNENSDCTYCKIPPTTISNNFSYLCQDCQNYKERQEDQNNHNSNLNDTSSVDNWADIIDTKESNSNTSNSMPTSIPLKNIYLCKTEKKEEKQKPIDHVDIEEAKIDNIKISSDLQLLEKSAMIAKNLKFQFNKRYDDDRDKFSDWLMKSLKWLRDVMFELAGRNFQLKNNVHDANDVNNRVLPKLCLANSPTLVGVLPGLCPANKNTMNISRNSYKFCEFGHNCRFNYNKEQKCYAQHYVYNLVYLDIVDILEYITVTNILNNKTINNTNNKISNYHNQQDMTEIKTSINTITYVINHMSEELSQLKNINPQYYKDYENRIFRFRSVSGFKHKPKKNKYFLSPQINTKFTTHTNTRNISGSKNSNLIN